jgi:hypothetical protein
LLSTLGVDVLINDNPTKALITNTNLSKDYNDKKISSLSPLNRGDFVIYEGKTYLIISDQSGERYNKHKAIMRQLPLTIKVNHNCNYIEVPCYVDGTGFDVIDGKIMGIASGNIRLHTQANEQTKQIKIGDRFIKFGQAFKVTGVDTLSRPGILTLICEKDTIGADDDIDNELAEWFGCKSDSEEPEQQKGIRIVIKSTANNPNEIMMNQTKEYIAEVYNGDTLLQDVAIKWELYADDKQSQTTLASIVEQTGNSCKVKNNNTYGHYVQLRAVLVEDESVEGWLRIRLRSLL